MNNDTLRFLQLLTGQADPVATFVTMRGGAPGKPLYDRPLRAVANTLAVLNRTGSDVYVTVNQTDGQGRRADNILTARSLFVDYDAKVPGTWEVMPTMLVESSPGKAQAYWMLREPTRDFKRWSAVNRSLVHATGGDENAVDLARILRVPGFVNHKYPDKPTVRILSASPSRVDMALMETYYPAMASGSAAAGEAALEAANTLDEAEKRRRFVAWLRHAGKPPAPGTGLRSWMFRKAAAGVRDFALGALTVAECLVQLDHDVDLPLLQKIAADASRYGQRPLGAALLERQPGAIRME
jgi:hypothetical protein